MHFIPCDVVYCCVPEAGIGFDQIDASMVFGCSLKFVQFGIAAVLLPGPQNGALDSESIPSLASDEHCRLLVCSLLNLFHGLTQLTVCPG